MNPTKALRIEQATEKDVPIILNFVRALAAYEQLSDAVSVDEKRIRDALFGVQPYAKAIIAYHAQDAIAFALYYLNYSSFTGLPGLYLEDIFVRPDARGVGVGQELMRYLAREEIHRGCGRMEWAVLNWNEKAINFYERLGAEPVKNWTVYRLSKDHLDKCAEVKKK